MDPDQNIDNENLSGQLQRLLLSIEASGRAILPRTNDALLRSIVNAAVHIFKATASSILLVNEEEQVLEFRVSYGSANKDLVGLKFPLDKGIAGYVVMTGQPIATSNVRQDERFNQDFAESTGYVPNSILATPLVSDGRIIGVMEVLDKIDASSFDMQDMELLGLFAQQAAIAIEQSQQIEEIEEALIHGLKRLAASDVHNKSPELVSALDEAEAHHGRLPDLLELADIFNAISSLGESERILCKKILSSFSEYRQSSRRFKK
jgi:GAF domain-containing protein